MQAEADIVRFVSRLPLLRGFSADGRQRLIDASQLMPLRSGELLYDQRTDPEYLYLVVNGRVRAEHFDHDEVTVRREIGRGESVGGMSILSARPHKARVRAIRDTRVLRIPAEAFLALFDAEPAAGRAVLNRWLNRFMESRSEERVRLSIGSLRTVAVVGAHDGAPVEAVARGLGAAFARFNLCLRLDRRLAEQRSGLRLDGDVEAMPVHVVHGVVVDAFVFADADDGHDVGVLQFRRRLCLQLEAGQEAFVECSAGWEYLEGHMSAETLLFGLVNDAHASATQLTEQAVFAELLAGW